MSFTPASTAEMAMNRLSVALAARRPRVVLPTPGGPQRMNECNLPASNARRSGLPGPSKCRCPTNSSSALGRRSSAKGGLGFVVNRSVKFLSLAFLIVDVPIRWAPQSREPDLSNAVGSLSAIACMMMREPR